MGADFLLYNASELLYAMKEATKICRNGWNFNGKMKKATELQVFCDNYERSQDIDYVKKFVSLASEPRALFSFTLFNFKFEFGKTKIGNTRSSRRFDDILSKIEKKRPRQSCDTSEQSKDLSEQSFDTSEQSKDLSEQSSYAIMLTLPQRRKIPQCSMFDTVCEGEDGIIKSVHGQARCFLNEEILEKLPIIKAIAIHDERIRTFFERTVSVCYTTHGKAIIHQQATRSCTAAATAMLIIDCGVKPDLRELFERNLGDTWDMLRDIQDAKLTPIESELRGGLGELRERLLLNGSAAINISDRYIGSHEIVVDNVSEDLSKVRIRDPYHGWEITVAADAFLSRISRGKTTLIQIKESPQIGEDMLPSSLAI